MHTGNKCPPPHNPPREGGSNFHPWKTVACLSRIVYTTDTTQGAMDSPAMVLTYMFNEISGS